MALALLPPDFFDLVLGFHSTSYFALLLWKCGCKLLNSKLSAGVTRLYLRNRRERFCASSGPSIAFNLRSLHSLTLHTAKTLAVSPLDASKLISSLPVSLEALDISAALGVQAFFNHAPESTYDDLKCIESHYTRGYSRIIDMETLFPRLRSLKIADSSKGEFLAPDFAGLPTSLTSIKVRTLIDPLDWQAFLDQLPPHLRSLGTIDFSSSPLPLPPWPAGRLPDLRSIDFLRRFGFRPQMLPPSLTSTAETFSWKLETSGAWPLPNLTELYLQIESFSSTAGTPWYSKLPKSVTALGFDAEGDDPEEQITSSDLYRLPSNVTRLIIAGESLALSDKADLRHCPASPLVDLSLYQDYLSLALFRQLPPTLRKLKVKVTTDAGNVFRFEELPPCLTDLCLQVDGQSLSYEGQLPKGLTYLDLNYNQMSQETFNLLPNSITSLTANFRRKASEVRSNSGWKLPTSIRSLIIQQWAADGLADLSQYQLLHLHIRELIGVDKSVAIRNGSLLEPLPSSLTTLLLNYGTEPGSNLHIPNQRMSHLQSLERLSISDIGVFDSSILREIPRNRLNRLEIKLSQVREEDAPFIPPNLDTLALGLRDLSAPWIAQYWPLHAENYYKEVAPVLHKRIAEHNNW